MQAVVTPSLIARLTRRRPRAQRAPEAADLGTELGMEHWLDERDTTLALAAARSVAAPTPVAKPAGGRTWLPRWLPGAPAR